MTQNTWHYSLFGLHLISDKPIEKLVEAPLEEQPNVTIFAYFGRLPANLAIDDPRIWRASPFQERIDWMAGENVTIKSFVTADNRYMQFAYPHGLIVVIDRVGNAIWTWWPETETMEHILPFFLGNSIGIFLRLKDVVCFHASAVLVDGKVLAFAGVSGMGKSTIATTLVRRGYGFVTDDLVAVTQSEGRYYVQPSYPQLRLLPETLSIFGYTPENLTLVHPETSKRFLNEDDFSFVYEPQPLGGIYTFEFKVDGANTLEIRALPPKQALITLMSRGYSNGILDGDGQLRLIQFLSQMVQQIPVYRVTALRDISKVENLADRILEIFRMEPNNR